MFKKFKQAVSAVLATAIAVSAMPMTVIAETETPMATGMSSNTTQYVLHASGSNAIQLNATNVNIGGSVYSGGNLDIYTAYTRIGGRAEMVGTLNKPDVRYSIYRTMPGAESRTYTDFSEAVYDSLGDDYTTHEWWQTYSGNYFANEGSIYAKSGLQFVTAETVLQDTVISEDSILISSSTALNTAPGEEVNLYTPKGNIGIYTGEVNFSGIIYAPNGTVQITGSNITINGVIIAKEILISGNNVTINENYNLSLIDYIETVETELDPYEDSDGDGLINELERYFGSDPMEWDTDGDSLNDYYELYMTKTDPTLIDTDDNGITDDAEDLDMDGLTNLEEYHIGTDPLNYDTDFDGLIDGDEIKIYGTDPFNNDTDGDGLYDADEVELGLDPTVPMTDGSTPDGQIIQNNDIPADSYLLNWINSDENSPFVVSLDLQAGGMVRTNFLSDVSPYASMIQSDALVGTPIAFYYDEDCKIDNAVIKFELKDELLSQTSNNIHEIYAEFEGVKKYGIFKYDEEANILVLVDTIQDGNTLSYETNEFGTYCVMDLAKWFDGLGLTPYAQDFVYNSSVSTRTLFAMTEGDDIIEVVESNSDEETAILNVIDDNSSEFAENGFEIHSDASNSSGEVSNEEENEGYSNPITDIAAMPNLIAPMAMQTLASEDSISDQIEVGSVDAVFMLDRMGTETNFEILKDYVKSEAEAIISQSIDPRVYIIGFSDYSQEDTVVYENDNGFGFATTTEELEQMMDKIEWSDKVAEKSTYGDSFYYLNLLDLRPQVDKYGFLLVNQSSTSKNSQDIRHSSIWDNIELRELNMSYILRGNLNWVIEGSGDRFFETGGVEMSIGTLARTTSTTPTIHIKSKSEFIEATAVLATRSQVVKIQITDAQGNFVDSDKDGIYNLQIAYDEDDVTKSEINANLLRLESGYNYSLPVLGQYIYTDEWLAEVKMLQGYSTETLKNNFSKLRGVSYIPLNSDPTCADGDDDGIEDGYDLKPLKKGGVSDRKDNFEDVFKIKAIKNGGGVALTPITTTSITNLPNSMKNLGNTKSKINAINLIYANGTYWVKVKISNNLWGYAKYSSFETIDTIDQMIADWDLYNTTYNFQAELYGDPVKWHQWNIFCVEGKKTATLAQSGDMVPGHPEYQSLLHALAKTSPIIQSLKSSTYVGIADSGTGYYAPATQGYYIDGFTLIGIAFCESGAGLDSLNYYGEADDFNTESSYIQEYLSRGRTDVYTALVECGIAFNQNEAKQIYNNDETEFYKNTARLITFFNNAFYNSDNDAKYELSHSFSSYCTAIVNSKQWQAIISSGSYEATYTDTGEPILLFKRFNKSELPELMAGVGLGYMNNIDLHYADY